MAGTWYIDVYSIYPINCCHQQQKHLLSHRKQLFWREKRAQFLWLKFNLLVSFPGTALKNMSVHPFPPFQRDAIFSLTSSWAKSEVSIASSCPYSFPKVVRHPTELPSWVCRFVDGCCVLTCFFLPINNAWRYPPGPQSRWNKHLIVFLKHVDKLPCHWWLLPSRFCNHCMLDTKQTIRLSSW